MQEARQQAAKPDSIFGAQLRPSLRKCVRGLSGSYQGFQKQIAQKRVPPSSSTSLRSINSRQRSGWD